MTPQQATYVQDAAGLVAAHLRADYAAQDVLLEAYSAVEAFPRLVEVFVYYIAAAVQVGANLTGSSWRQVLVGLADEGVGMIPGVRPDWASVRALVANLIEPVHAGRGPTGMEVTSMVEGAYGLAVSVTRVLGRVDGAGALAWATQLSMIAARES